MPTGGHFVTGPRTDVETDTSGLHFEQGVGWGPLPKRAPETKVYADIHMDPHNESMAQLWAGGRSTWATEYAFKLYEWDGAVWTAHHFFGGGASYGGHTAVSRAPGTDRVVFVGCCQTNGFKSILVKFDDGVWSVLRAAGGYTQGAGATPWFIPMAINENTCVWVAHGTYDDGGGAKCGYWLDPTTQYSGGDLPVRGFGSIAQLANGQVFLLDLAGHVWRADSHLGPFVEDNPTCGPHVDGFNYLALSDYPVAMAASADGQTIVIQNQIGGGYWVRNGYDDYTRYNTGLTGSGQPAAINRQMLFQASHVGPPRASYDGGASWSVVSNGYAQVGNTLRASSCCAFLSEISTQRRLIATVSSGESGIIYWLTWRGDAPFSPWAPMGEVYGSHFNTGSFQRLSCVTGFETRHIVVSGYRNFGSHKSIAHYDPDTDSWQYFAYISDTSTALTFGTEFAPGLIHALLYGRYSTPLKYGRWNGAFYDIADIPGSSRHSTDNFATYDHGYNIHADESGLDIWVTVEEYGQLWHSSDGGATWVNRYAAAAAVHADAQQAKDVFVASATEVWVAFAGPSPGTRFSRWTGGGWVVGAPDLAKDAGRYRCLFKDRAGSLWFAESKYTAGPNETYKLVSGAWVLQDTYSYAGGSRYVTGFAELGQGAILAIAMDTENSTGLDGYLQTLAEDEPLLGWHTNRTGDGRPPFKDVTDWGPINPIQLTSVSPSVIDNLGGEVMTLSGVFPTDRTVTVHLGPLGTVDDPLCYGGQGLASAALSLDGVTLQIISPPTPVGAATISAVDGIDTATLEGVGVVEHNWPQKLHQSRCLSPPWLALGARRLDSEGPVS